MLADAANSRPTTEWDYLLPDVEYALNTSTNTSTGQTPFALLYNTEPRPDINPSLSRSDFTPAEDFI